MKIINLGCGKKIRPEAINVDIMPGEGIDVVSDILVYLLYEKAESADIIYASHIIEHFADQKQIIYKIMRVLKKGGILHITGPHSSCVTSIGCLGHYRTYSYNTFHDYLCKPWYMFKEPKFRTVYQKLSWWYEKSGDNVPKVLRPFIGTSNFIINFFIALSPRLFENIWWPLVGGAREVTWIGEKI